MRYAAGTPTKLPPRVLVHMVAARYGQSPEAVREWTATDYLDALAFLGVTRAG
jgi:hypothetical protein